jgi:hypothetical protein
MAAAFLLLLVGGAVVWKLFAPSQRFLAAFGGLLADPVMTRSAAHFLTGRSYMNGMFAGRRVALRMQLKRTRYGQGYLVIALETAEREALDAIGIETRLRDDDGRRALFHLAAEDVLLSAESGWVKALWQPQGFVIFPGRFSEEKWRKVLTAMNTVAGSLESPA